MRRWWLVVACVLLAMSVGGMASAQLKTVKPRLVDRRVNPTTGTVYERYKARDGIEMKVTTWKLGKRRTVMKDIRVFQNGVPIPELKFRGKLLKRSGKSAAD